MRLLQRGIGFPACTFPEGEKALAADTSVPGFHAELCAAWDSGEPERLADSGGLHGGMYPAGPWTEGDFPENMPALIGLFSVHASDGASGEASG